MLKPVHSTVSMIMDRAYEGAETRQLVLELGFYAGRATQTGPC